MEYKMIKKEINEIKSQYTLEECGILRLCGDSPEIFYRRIFMRKMVSVMFQAHRCCGHFLRREVS